MKMIDMVLTCLVNNDYLLNRVIEDVNERFDTKVDKEKLINLLSTYECTQDKHTANVW